MLYHQFSLSRLHTNVLFYCYVISDMYLSAPVFFLSVCRKKLLPSLSFEVLLLLLFVHCFSCYAALTLYFLSYLLFFLIHFLQK